MKVQSLFTPLSNDTVSHLPKIAYLILVHRFPMQFKRLFAAIYDSDNHYLVHLDKKADKDTSTELRTFLAQYPNAYILERSDIKWGGYSMVQAELNGMKHLLSINADWDFFINLSGQDYPLRSQNEVRQFLASYKDSSFITVARQATERPDTMNRIENYFTETGPSLFDAVYKRAYMKDVTPYIGEQWMILSRACCAFICTSPEVKKFEDYYANTLIADEGFFQTVLMNTTFSGTLINNNKRAIVCVPGSRVKPRPRTFTLADLAFLLASDDLFARKFDDAEDCAIIDALRLNRLDHAPQRSACIFKTETIIDSIN